MKEQAYEKLVDSISKNELELFLKTSGKYLVADKGDRGVGFMIDYYAMASALNAFIEQHPDNKIIIKNGIMKVLKESSISGVRSIIEMTAYQLRYGGKQLGFLDEEILEELKKQIHIHEKDFLNNSDYNYEELDELSFMSSGRHFM